MFMNLAWYRRTKALVPPFDPKVHLFENSLLKLLAQLSKGSIYLGVKELKSKKNCLAQSYGTSYIFLKKLNRVLEPLRSFFPQRKRIFHWILCWCVREMDGGGRVVFFLTHLN